MTKIEQKLKESVDTTTTETEEPSQSPRKQAPSWSIIKKRWLAGDSVNDIAEEMGVPKPTIYDHSHRYEWPPRGSMNPNGKALAALHPEQQKALQAAAHQHIEAVQPLVSEAVRKNLQDYFDGVIKTTKSIHRKLDEKLDRKLEVEELKSLALTLSSIDQTARRTFGLDQPGAAGVAWASSAVARSCPVIDVEAVPVADSEAAK